MIGCIQMMMIDDRPSRAGTGAVDCGLILRRPTSRSFSFLRRAEPTLAAQVHVELRIPSVTLLMIDAAGPCHACFDGVIWIGRGIGRHSAKQDRLRIHRDAGGTEN
jgi:hypothetical protein